MFHKIFLEQSCQSNLHAKKILSFFNDPKPILIDSYEQIFGQVKKPYLQKRETLNLFIAKKKGELVKPTPIAYGHGKEPHYYYIHAFNCIYECEYCYLQGYFNSPDLVLFVNHDEILEQMKETLESHPEQEKVWFHAGEYSDSLALSHITGELEIYHEFCKKNLNCFIELRTKSANIKELKKLEALPNFVVSYSLSPAEDVKTFDHKTAPLKARLNAIKVLMSRGFSIGLHFDPIIYNAHTFDDYEALFDNLFDQHFKQSQLQYISLGVVRFTSQVFHQVKKNYPSSKLLQAEFITSFDQKKRYPKIFRSHLLQSLKSQLIERGVTESKIYLCMEQE